MAFKSIAVAIGTGDTDVQVCPATTEGALVLGVGNISAGAIVATIKLYKNSTGVTQTLAVVSVAANSEYKFPVPISMEQLDKITVSAATISTLVATGTFTYSQATPVATGFNPKGVFSTIANYAKNDVVSFVDSGSKLNSYLAIQASLNQNPETQTAYWMKITGEGIQGIQGPSGTLAVGTVTTGAAGSSVVINNTGTSSAASLDITIPKGDKGDQGAGFAATSTTSLLIATGSKAFATQTGLAYTVGARVRAVSAANVANWMEGLVASYTTGTLTLTIDKIGGSGTKADWNINLTGQPGAGDMISTNNLSDLANAGTARTNLGLGTAAVVATGTSGATIPVLNANNTHSGANAFTGANTYDKTQTANEGTLTSASAPDFSTKQRWKATVNGSSFTIANPTSPVDKTLYDVAVDFTTSHALSFGTNFKIGDYVSTAVAGKKDRLVFEYDSTATLFYLRGYRKDVGT